jgi:glutamine synthetase
VVDNLPLANPLCQLLGKERAEFTRADMLKVVTERQIERFSFHYTGIDGQLKELKLPFSDTAMAERILAAGERVDGSSLFKGLLDASESDLYVVPSYATAFLNPFDPTSLDFICRFIDRHGELAPFTPDNVLHIAHERFQERTGLELHALGELEFFLLRDGGDEYFTPAKQTGYHASSPFFKSGDVVIEMVRHLEQITGSVKYAHAEVGYIDSVHSDRPMLVGRKAEQHEIELLTKRIDVMGDFIALAKWVIRNVAFRHGMLATFAPKIEEGIAGNGFHVHMELLEGERNIMATADGSLSDHALKLIGGLVHHAATLSAFGNTVASAYLRLVPNQEAPTRICWSDLNRSALIRVPLGWGKKQDLAKVVNPVEPTAFEDNRGVQTVEIRSPDGSAMFHLLLAGLTNAAEYGLIQEGMIELAQKTRVTGNVFDQADKLTHLEPLPTSCVAASRLLLDRRALYEEHGNFPPQMIDHVAEILAREDDEFLNERLSHMSAEERLHATRQLMHRDIHRH